MRTFSFETVIRAKDFADAQKIHNRLKDVYLKLPKIFDATTAEQIEYHDLKEIRKTP